MKSAASNAKMTSDGIKGRLHCEGRAQWRPCEMRHKKRIFQKMNRVSVLWDNFKCPNVHVIGDPAKRGEQKRCVKR